MSFSENIPDEQECVRCGEKIVLGKRTFEGLESREKISVENLIGVSLDFFVDKYPQIKDYCDDPMDFAIDLCEKCEKLWNQGKLDISWDEIKKHAYRFI